jgi:hypothetical protein
MIQPNQLRKNALSWWNCQNTNNKMLLTKKYCGQFVNYQFLDGGKIETIYEAETGFKPMIDLGNYSLKQLL